MGECPICEESYDEEMRIPVCLDPCGHMICKSCHDGWVSGRGTCCYCRKPVTRFIRVYDNSDRDQSQLKQLEERMLERERQMASMKDEMETEKEAYMRLCEERDKLEETLAQHKMELSGKREIEEKLSEVTRKEQELVRMQEEKKRECELAMFAYQKKEEEAMALQHTLSALQNSISDLQEKLRNEEKLRQEMNAIVECCHCLREEPTSHVLVCPQRPKCLVPSCPFQYNTRRSYLEHLATEHPSVLVDIYHQFAARKKATELLVQEEGKVDYFREASVEDTSAVDNTTSAREQAQQVAHSLGEVTARFAAAAWAKGTEVVSSLSNRQSEGDHMPPAPEDPQ